MLEKHGLAWENLIFRALRFLQHNERGKSGMETRMREKVDHLLDIDGEMQYIMRTMQQRPSTHRSNFFLEGLFNLSVLC